MALFVSVPIIPSVFIYIGEAPNSLYAFNLFCRSKIWIFFGSTFFKYSATESRSEGGYYRVVQFGNQFYQQVISNLII